MISDPSDGGTTAPTEPTTHELKVWPRYFGPLSDGIKTFEYREDDRTPQYAEGDVLRLREYTPPSMGDDEYGCLVMFREHYTGRECLRKVTYVARGGLIPAGYCVMSIVPASLSPESSR